VRTLAQWSSRWPGGGHVRERVVKGGRV